MRNTNLHSLHILIASRLLSQILEKVPKNVDPRSLTLSNKPFGGEDRKLSQLQGVAIERVGLRFVLADYIVEVPGLTKVCLQTWRQAVPQVHRAATHKRSLICGATHILTA